jgi:hypothetical protein
MNATITDRMIVAAQTGETDDVDALRADIEQAIGGEVTRRLVESDTQNIASHAIMVGLADMTGAIARDRGFKAIGADNQGSGAASRDDLIQTAAAAVWSAVTTWDVEADNRAEFTTRAFDVADKEAKGVAFAEAAPGVSRDAAARYAGALGRANGDHEAAVLELTTRDEKRMSLDLANAVRAAFEGPAYINAGGDAERAASALDASDEVTPDKWAERNGGELAEHLTYPLDVSRDAVRVRGLSTSGKGSQKGEKSPARTWDGRSYAVSVRAVGEPYVRPDSEGEFVKHVPRGQGKGNGWKENGAVVDREEEFHDRKAAEHDASFVLDEFTPAQREVLDAAMRVEGGFTKDGRVSAAKVAEATGKNRESVKKTVQRLNKVIEKVRATR